MLPALLLFVAQCYQIRGASLPLFRCQALDLTRDLNTHIPLYPIQHYIENPVRRETIVNR